MQSKFPEFSRRGRRLGSLALMALAAGSAAVGLGTAGLDTAGLDPAGSVAAGEWPQILGPQRNGKAVGERLSSRWPADGPRTVWQRPVGSGYAGVAVAGGRVVLFHRIADEALAEALDARSGKPLWKQKFPTRYQKSIAPDDGPLCVPLVHEGRVYLFGADGDLHCLKLDSGEVVWSRDAAREYGAPAGYFGDGSTPIVDSGKLLVNIGASPAGVVAFSLSDGKTLWESAPGEASYSSPVATTQAGVRHVIFVLKQSVVSVDPDTGKVQFRFPFGMRGPTVNAAMPLVFGDELFVTASYGIGAQLVKIAGDKPKTLWADDDLMSSQYTTCIEKAGTLYGIHGRQDAGVAKLRAFDLATRKVFWTEEGFGTGNLILADDKLLIMKTDGELMLAEPTSEEFRPLASAKIFSDVVQPLPALADGLLYVRDTRTLKCLDLGKPAKGGR